MTREVINRRTTFVRHMNDICFKSVMRLSGNSHVLTVPRYLVKTGQLSPTAEYEVSLHITKKSGDDQ